METKYKTHRILEVVLLVIVLASILAGNSRADENTKYLEAVREFADNVLKYGRDTYGPKHTPLFVDGLNIHTHDPVKWISPEGERWILSNLASQQNLFRTLDGLTKITGDPKYRQAAMEAIKHAFENLRAPNGLLYWGGVVAYDAHGDNVCGKGRHQTLKYNYPYYELMWEVNPKITNEFIEAFWMSNIFDWSNLDMNRYSQWFSVVRNTSKIWDHEYEGGDVFFKSAGSPFFNAGSDLFYAAAILSKLSGEKEPLIWSKRLAHRYIETRNPKTGISGYVYSRREPDEAQIHLGDDFKGHLVLSGTLFPALPEFRKRTIELVQQVRGWICELLLGDLLQADGEEFTRWALEELVAWGKAAYRKEDNSFIPMLTDGTSLEGYVFRKGGYYGPKGMVIRAWPLGPIEFWAYSLAYRMSEDEYIWEMVRNIGQGSGFGDIGVTPTHESSLQTDTACADPHALLGFLELYKATAENRFLEIAQRIGDNILSAKFYRGFFVPSKEHIYTRFDVLEHLTLLHLHVAMKPEVVEVPRVWPSYAVFLCDYRNRLREVDIYSIYKLTESPELPISLHEAATLGYINKCMLLISQGTDIDVWDAGSMAPLHYAAINGHKQVVELLLAKGSDINTESVDGFTALDVAARKGHINVVELLIGKGANVNTKDRIGSTPLHSAADGGHTEVARVLLTKGADVNAKNNDGQTPLDIAINRNRKDIVELLVEKGAVLPSSIHEAASFGVLAGVKAFLEQGVDVNVQDDKGFTPLHYTAREDNKELTEFLIAKGADVNAKTEEGLTPLTFAVRRENKDMIKILVAKGADVNFAPKSDYPPLYYAVWDKDKESVEFFVNNGAKFDVKDRDGWTAFRYAASQGSRELVEFFVSKGADVSSFHMAACLGDLARVKNFVEQGTDVDTKDELGWTPLCWAVSIGQEEVVEFLIANGANINVETSSNRTPLHQAALGGERKLAELFISRGAEVDAKDRRGDTPLYNAASVGHREVVELLIAKGANVDEKNRQGQTPLYRAVQKGRKDVVEVLIDKGADIDSKVKSGQTPLHYTAIEGRKDIAAVLIAKGADVNSKDSNGQTPLHLSVREGNRDVAELLIASGADTHAKNRWNRTPLDLAAGRGHTEIVELLRKHGAKE